MMEGGALPPSPAGKPGCLSAVTLPASIRGHSRQPRVPRTKPVKTSREASQFQTWCEDSCHLGNQKRCLFLGLRAVQTFPGPTPSDAQFLLTVPHGHIVPQEILSEVQMARLPLSALVLNPRFPLLGFLRGLASKPSCVADGGCETPSSWCLQRLLLSRTRVCRQGPGCRMPRWTERVRKDGAGPFTGIIIITPGRENEKSYNRFQARRTQGSSLGGEEKEDMRV